MILVVAGPTTAKFTRLLANIVTKGARTLVRFFSEKTPPRLEGIAVVPNDESVPGYVRARITGRAVWREKYTGNMAC